MTSCPTCRYYQNCLQWKSELPESGCSSYRADRSKQRKPKKESLCWHCARLDCSWMKNLEPIAGWKAKKTIIRYGANGKDLPIPSYRVESCPGYVPAKKEETNV